MKQRHFTLFLLLFTLCLSLSACGIAPDTESPQTGYISDIPTPSPSFEQFTTELFCKEVSSDTISLHYTLANPERYGITEETVTLGNVTDSLTSNKHADDLYIQLLSYDREQLSAEEQRTRDTLERHLNLLMEDNFSPYLSELLGPVTGFQAQLPILLAEYRFDSAKDVDDYLTLLSGILPYFTDIADFEKEKSAAGYFMDDTTAREIIAQCEAFIRTPDDNYLISTFEERLDALSLSPSERADFLVRNQNELYTSVYPAYELLIDTLTACLGTGENPYGMSYFKDGKEYYALLTRFRTGSDRSVEDIRELLVSGINSACLTMADALKKDPSLYSSALSFQYPETEPDAILQYVVQASAEDFPVIDCGTYVIKAIPEALQEYVSPAMYLTPPMDNYEFNVIYINENPIYDATALFPTIVHEGYPGHLYQTVSALSGDVHPLRYLISPVGYEEGWATYVEHYSYAYAGLSDPLTAFLQADLRASLYLYALSDICIHYEGYTPEQLSTLLATYGFASDTADLIYQTLLSEPGSYLPYAVGLLEFLELKESAKELWQTSYSDYDFHAFLMATGPMPFSLLKKELAAR